MTTANYYVKGRFTADAPETAILRKRTIEIITADSDTVVKQTSNASKKWHGRPAATGIPSNGDHLPVPIERKLQGGTDRRLLSRPETERNRNNAPRHH